MPYIIGRAAREHELYERLKAFVTGVGFLGRATFSGAGNGSLIDPRLLDLASGETYTLTCNGAAPRGGSFTVVGSVRGNLPVALVNQVYVDPKIQFCLDMGSTDFALGDQFTLKFVEYSAQAKPKISSLSPTVGTVTEEITLTCNKAGTAVAGAEFSVAGSVSGDHGTLVQGQEFTCPVLRLTLDLGDLANVSLRFAVGDTVKIHTTQNPLRATGQHWAIRRDPKQVPGTQFGVPIPASDSEIILQGPGLAGADEILVGIRRSWSAAGASWELAGMRGYAAGLTYNEQPNILPLNRRPRLLMWTGQLPYWISVTGRRITVKIRNNTYYMDLYLGLGIPWGSPKYQPYFLCIGGSSGNSETLWTSLAVENCNYWAARANSEAGSSMQVLNRAGAWQGHLSRTNNARDGWAGGGLVNSAENGIWPYRVNAMSKLRENLDGSTPLLAVTLTPDMGELEGVMAVSGYGNIQPEDIILQSSTGRRFVVGTNTYRNSQEDFSATELV